MVNLCLTCERCGKTFYREKNHIRKRHFCSPECLNKSKESKYRPGTKYAYLTIEGFVEGVRKHSRKVLRCRCVCGKETQVATGMWRKIKSCGCMKNKTHGLSHSGEYRAWNHMNSRCNCKSTQNYERYGGRGIKVLYKNFEEFLTDVGPKPGPEYSIDRIDVNGNYEKGNCRWATIKEQQNNKSSNTRFKIGEETHTISERANIMNVKYYKARNYLIKNGEKIFSK